MIGKFVVVGADDVPKDLAHNAKFRTRLISNQGISMKGINYPDPKFHKEGFNIKNYKWVKQKYYEIDFVYKSGSFKEGSNYKSEGHFNCWTFFSKKKASEHVESYRNNPAYEKNILKKLYIVETFDFFDFFLVQMATRCVLKNKFGYKNIYGGFPFAGNIFYVINNEKEEKKK